MGRQAHKNVRKDKKSDLNRHYQRWNHNELLEFCQLYPEVDDEFELANYFHRTRLAIRSLKARHHRLCELGGDPTTLRFVYMMEMSASVLYTIASSDWFKTPSVFDSAPKIK